MIRIEDQVEDRISFDVEIGIRFEDEKLIIFEHVTGAETDDIAEMERDYGYRE